MTRKRISIANGATESSEVDIDGAPELSVEWPAAITAASFDVEAKLDAGTFGKLHAEDGTKVTLTPQAGAIQGLDLLGKGLRGIVTIRLVGDVAEAAERNFFILT